MTCPNCGYCPHCGRSAQPPYYGYPQPYYHGPVWVSPTYQLQTTSGGALGGTFTSGSLANYGFTNDGGGQ